MSAPFFFIEAIGAQGTVQVLPEDTSKHVVQVLRMTEGDSLHLTDGRGGLADVVIADPHKKRCSVTIISSKQQTSPSRQTTIAISLLKNSTRFEWFLEKATELGVAAIVPLLCSRTEKQHFRVERMRSILISAMLQSQQAWLPELPAPVSYNKFLTEDTADAGLYIAHCEPGEKKSLLAADGATAARNIILIGPEGDFTPEEIALATANNYQPVSLGNTRLRTETAGVIAATLLQLR